MSRFLLLSALALVAAHPLRAQGEPVEAWYRITAGDRTEVVHAHTVTVERASRGFAVRAARLRFSHDGNVSIAFLDLYEDGQTKPPPSSEQDRTVFRQRVDTTIYDDGSTEVRTSRTKENDNGTTTTTTTTTTTEADGTTTTTETTTTETTEKD